MVELQTMPICTCGHEHPNTDFHIGEFQNRWSAEKCEYCNCDDYIFCRELKPDVNLDRYALVMGMALPTISAVGVVLLFNYLTGGLLIG